MVSWVFIAVLAVSRPLADERALITIPSITHICHLAVLEKYVARHSVQVTLMLSPTQPGSDKSATPQAEASLQEGCPWCEEHTTLWLPFCNQKVPIALAGPWGPEDP